MKILIDENNNIIAYASVGDIPNIDGSTELNVEIPNELIEEQYEEEQEDGSLSLITIAKDLTHYKYVNGEFIPNGKERIKEAQIEIATLKQGLAKTDYKALKYAEGFISDEDYESIRAERQSLRNEINRLELLVLENS